MENFIFVEHHFLCWAVPLSQFVPTHHVATYAKLEIDYWYWYSFGLSYTELVLTLIWFDLWLTSIDYFRYFIEWLNCVFALLNFNCIKIWHGLVYFGLKKTKYVYWQMIDLPDCSVDLNAPSVQEWLAFIFEQVLH